MTVEEALKSCRDALVATLRAAPNFRGREAAVQALNDANEALATHDRLRLDSPNPMRITQWIDCGEFNKVHDTNLLYAEAGRLLDDASSHDIFGSILFQAEDGKFYTLTVEGCLAEASPDYVLDQLSDRVDSLTAESG